MSYEVRDRYLARRERGTRYEVTTPEGIPLSLTIASAGDRANAFILDTLVMIGIVLAVILPATWAGAGRGEAGWSAAFAQLVAFLVRNFYFVWFELKWQGATLGKRWVGIRVIDAEGGPLTADAVVARNLTRDLEVFLPLLVLFAPSMLWPEAPGWAMAISAAWLVVFAFLPLFNRHRLRIGDLVAGTMVVLAPKALLLADQGGAAARRAASGDGLAFTDAQLDVYGIFELQVLEDVLRRDRTGGLDRKAMETVCRRIQSKIKWDREAAAGIPVERFLREFYAALRARLEHRMLLGRRKEDKFSKA